jgi:hypothetical protein
VASVRHQSPHEIIVVIDGNTALFERARREIAGVRVLVPCTYVGMPQNDGRVRNLIGANMSVRAEVLRRAGGFASKLGRREAGGAIIGSVAESCEETEFCIGAARLHPGGMWIHCEKARVLHVGTRQRTTWRYFVRRCRMKGTAKAVLTGPTGTRDGLGSERRYTRTLVVSILRHIVSGNLTRVATIFAGLTITAAYGRGRLARDNF